jgi:multiple sugar transport system ATP-binding protein
MTTSALGDNNQKGAKICLKALRKVFGSHVLAVDIDDLTIQSEEMLTLLGPSGCGKSTTLRLIAGLEQPDEGDISFDGVSMLNTTPARRDVAMVFQNYALYPHLTAQGNLEYGLRKRKTPRLEMNQIVADAADLLGIVPLLSRKPRELSGGQQQRVALGRAIVRSPKVFLLDEPLSNLDARLRHQMRAEIITLHRRLKATLVYVTHDQYEAMTMSDRLAVMRRGKILQCDTPQNIYKHPVNRFVATFVGSPNINLLGGRIRQDATSAPVFCCGEGIEIPLSLWKNELAVKKISEDEVVEMGVRPEDIYLATAEEHFLRAQVKIVEFTGPELIVTFATSAGDIVSRHAPDASLRVGDNVFLSFNLDKIHIFDQRSGNKIDLG